MALKTVESVGRSDVKKWDSLTSADTGEPLELPRGALAGSVQFVDEGSFAGNIAMQGSLDGVTYFDLNTPGGTAISSITAAGLYNFIGAVRFIKPVPDGAMTGTVSVFVLVRS